MTLRSTPIVVALLVAGTLPIHAQQSIGTLKTEGAEIGGLVRVSNGQATLGNSGDVKAGAQPAEIALKRGGTVRVCGGSAMHLSQSTLAVNRPPLLLAVDRGAAEIRLPAQKTDSILTPDLRFELSGAAPLDLRIRVVPNGDTCVDNAGKDAPMLHVTETFGNGAYFIRPGQRVLFEHGSLQEVVDHETTSCGCPKNDVLVLAGKGKPGDGKVTEAAKANPFPEAVSQGLTSPEVPKGAAPVGEIHTQVSSTLNYNGTANTVTGPPGETTTAASLAPGTTATDGTTPAASAPVNGATTDSPTDATAPPAQPATNVHVEESAPPPAGPNLFRAIGRFFHRLFGSH